MLMATVKTITISVKWCHKTNNEINRNFLIIKKITDNITTGTHLRSIELSDFFRPFHDIFYLTNQTCVI